MTPTDDPEPPTLVALLRALIEDAQTLVEAETAYWRTALGFALRRARTLALLAALALALAFFMLMALVVGLLLALAPLVGPWGALALVTAALGLAAAVCAWRAVALARRTVRLLTRADDGDGQ